ncbi:MAG: lipoprotein [Legionella sp.]|nr:lipoprotein [Legionella sp.]
MIYIRLLLITGLLINLTGCGLKGPLYLPKSEKHATL